MKVLFMIHRSKGAFLKEKEVIREIVKYFKKDYLDLKFIDKKIKFSILKGDNIIDFDYGYYNMHKKPFQDYDYIISTGLFAIFNEDIMPGDIIFPNQTGSIYITPKRTKIIIDKQNINFKNPMLRVFNQIIEFEKKCESTNIKSYINKSFKYLANKEKIRNLDKIKIINNAKMITCNTLFIPSELKKTKSYIKQKGELNTISNLQECLEQSYDGLNCETMDLIKSIPDKLYMISWGLDKPYSIAELSNQLRDVNNYSKILPTFNVHQKIYFMFIFFEYLFNRDLIIG